MGLPLPVVRLLVEHCRARPAGGAVLTLGVQDIDATPAEVDSLLAGAPLADAPAPLRPGEAIKPDRFFKSLGFGEYQSLDLLGSEGASIIHDLSQPVPHRWRNHFELVIDGGTLEHVFDIAAALRHIVSLLKVGGAAFHVSPLSGWENHGFYSINPKLLARFYRANGFEVGSAHVVRLTKTGPLRAARIDNLNDLDAPLQADSLREYALLVLAARKVTEPAAIIAPIDTHQKAAPEAAGRLRDDLLYWQQEQEFTRVCEQGEALCGPGPRDRYYVIKEYLTSLGRLDADTAECGIYRGLGSWIIRHYAQQLPRCAGYRHHLFDSFEGLSTPSSADAPAAGVRPWRAGDMAWSLEDVKQTLARWDDLTFHRGWIPACFDAAREARFAFVHIDVDLYEPTRAALAYFHPRLVTGGIIVIDDDGFLTCPGARRAVDEFSSATGQRIVRLPTGQAIIAKAR